MKISYVMIISFLYSSFAACSQQPNAQSEYTLSRTQEPSHSNYTLGAKFELTTKFTHNPTGSMLVTGLPFIVKRKATTNTLCAHTGEPTNITALVISDDSKIDYDVFVSMRALALKKFFGEDAGKATTKHNGKTIHFNTADVVDSSPSK